MALDIDFVTIGSDDKKASTYFIKMEDGKLDWSNNAPTRFVELIKTRKCSKIDEAALGANNAWYLKYEDGKSYSGNITDPELLKFLKSK